MSSFIAMIVCVWFLYSTKSGERVVDRKRREILLRDVKNPASLKRALVVYSDYECPPCRAVVPKLIEADRSRKNSILSLRNYPLTQIHKNAFEMAVLYEVCKINRLDIEAKTIIYSGLINPDYAQIKMKLSKLASRFLERDRLKAIKRVEQDIYDGDVLLIESTPSIFYLQDNKFARISNEEAIQRLKSND
jgi:hypothetical protein